MHPQQRRLRQLDEAVKRPFKSRSVQAGTMLAIVRSAPTKSEQLALLGNILTTYRAPAKIASDSTIELPAAEAIDSAKFTKVNSLILNGLVLMLETLIRDNMSGFQLAALVMGYLNSRADDEERVVALAGILSSPLVPYAMSPEKGLYGEKPADLMKLCDALLGVLPLPRYTIWYFANEASVTKGLKTFLISQSDAVMDRAVVKDALDLALGIRQPIKEYGYDSKGYPRKMYRERNRYPYNDSYGNSCNCPECRPNYNNYDSDYGSYSSLKMMKEKELLEESTFIIDKQSSFVPAPKMPPPSALSMAAFDQTGSMASAVEAFSQKLKGEAAANGQTLGEVMKEKLAKVNKITF